MRFILLALAACSIPDKHPGTGDGGTRDGTMKMDGGTGSDGKMIDAAAGAYSCLGQPFQGTATPAITFSGRVYDPIGGTVVASTTVQLIERSTNNARFTVTNDNQGMFAQTLQTNLAAIDAFYSVAPPPSLGYLRTLQYPQHPYVADNTASLPVVTPGGMNTLAMQGGTSYVSSDSVAAIEIFDCNGTPVAGATIVQAGQPGLVRYAVNGIPSPNTMVTDASGIVFVFKIPAGTVLGIQAIGPGGQQFRTYSVTPTPDTWTQVGVQP